MTGRSHHRGHRGHKDGEKKGKRRSGKAKGEGGGPTEGEKNEKQRTRATRSYDRKETPEAGGVGSGETVLGEGSEELAENVVNVDGGEVFAGGRSGDLPAQLVGFDELALGAGMENAKSGMILVPEHAALAAVGKREKT